ncbi:MAG: hypothetical protein M3Q57_02935 [Pseudomonadota bacterium]|nr:hypothetical protein [Pseudomonadota bacterium]
MLRTLIIVGGLFAATASAAPAPADPAMLPLFEKTCLDGELSRAAREAAIAADGGWTVADPSTLAFDQLGTAKSNEPFYDFKKPQDVKLWSRTVDGKQVRAVLASYAPKKSRYATVCALLVPGVPNGMAYFDGFRGLMKSAGLKGKSTDLPHYVEFTGKLADGRKSRADLFSRTQVTPGERDTMHLYIAF